MSRQYIKIVTQAPPVYVKVSTRRNSNVLSVNGRVGVVVLTAADVKKRVVTVTQSATPTINTDNGDIFQMLNLSTDIVNMSTNLSGTPSDGEMRMLMFQDNELARAINWGSLFQSTTNATLPDTTVANTLLRVLVQWNAAAGKWDCISVG